MIIKAPHPVPAQLGPSVFLGGAIDMGQAENWQDPWGARLEAEGFVVLDPRRPDWDSSWKQSADDAQFRAQVEWELAAMERADHVLMHLPAGSKAPVSMLELGLWARSGKAIVLCAEGFYRKGNIDLTCRRYGVTQVSSLDEVVRECVRRRSCDT